MTKEELLSILYGKDDIQTYKKFQDIEKTTYNSNELYVYLSDILKALSEDKSYIKVKSFRLICLLSKYDTNSIINNNIEYILSVLDDDKPSSIRQYLKYIMLILKDKTELKETIVKKVNKINITQFNDSMAPLIKKDIDSINNMYNYLDK